MGRRAREAQTKTQRRRSLAVHRVALDLLDVRAMFDWNRYRNCLRDFKSIVDFRNVSSKVEPI